MSETKKKKKTTKTDNAERADRRALVWELKTGKGLSQRQIAAEVGASVATVNRDLAFWTNQIISELSDIAERETAYQIYQLRKIVAESLRAWYESTKPHVKTVIKEVFGKKGSTLENFNPEKGEWNDVLLTREVTTTTTERLPVIGYLQAAMSAMESLRKLLGLNAPEKVELDWKMELLKSGVVNPERLDIVFEQLVNEAYELIVAAESNGSSGVAGE